MTDRNAPRTRALKTMFDPVGTAKIVSVIGIILGMLGAAEAGYLYCYSVIHNGFWAGVGAIGAALLAGYLLLGMGLLINRRAMLVQRRKVCMKLPSPPSEK